MLVNRQNEKQMNCPICSWTPSDEDYVFIGETQYWRICLAPNQRLLGRCVIHLKRHAGDLADLTRDEWNDFLNIVKRVEETLKSAFDATMFNWSCYMNHAYQEKHPHPHVHWWAVPRYAQVVQFGGETFEDPNFGSPYEHSLRLDLPKNSRDAIAEKIRETYV